MTTGSLYETTGISIDVFQPIIVPGTSYVPEGRHVAYLTKEISEYNHAIVALGGYQDAYIQIAGKTLDIQEWINRGLGRHISVKNHALGQVWEGFVNRIEIAHGGVTLGVGPLMTIANRASAVYTPLLDATVYPPVTGTSMQGVIYDNDDSRARFGTIEKILAAGTCTDAESDYYVAAYLTQMAWPENSTMLAIGQADVPTIRLECLGYNAWLSAYTYLDDTVGTTTLSAKLQSILAADYDGLFSTDYNYIDANAYLTPTEELDIATAWTIIQSITALGDVNDARWTFGIYDGRKAYYRAVPTVSQVAYSYTMSDKLQQIKTMGGISVYPWDVRPAQWVFLTDLLIGQSAISNLYRDPRYIFIEEVRYTAPWQLELNGQRVGTINQLMAKMGLGGMG